MGFRVTIAIGGLGTLLWKMGLGFTSYWGFATLPVEG